jgi:hypothetical protein
MIGVNTTMRIKDKRKSKNSRPDGAKKIDHRMLPVGKVLSDPIKGKFLSLPLFSWVGIREKTETPLVMVTLLLLPQSKLSSRPAGTLQVEMPVFDETLENTVAALGRYGWDGRVWPKDDGWPTGSPMDEEHLQHMMEASGLKNTLVFPPSDKGDAVQEVNVARAKGPFLMPPLPVADKVDPQKVERLSKLCEDPSIFL